LTRKRKDEKKKCTEFNKLRCVDYSDKAGIVGLSLVSILITIGGYLAFYGFVIWLVSTIGVVNSIVYGVIMVVGGIGFILLLLVMGRGSRTVRKTREEWPFDGDGI
jgi:hypothetical protein